MTHAQGLRRILLRLFGQRAAGDSKQTLHVSLLTLISRAVGFLRVIAMSVWVGSRNVAHAFTAANQIPNVFFEVIAGGALSAAVVPVLADPLAQRDHKRASKIASAILTWSLLLGLVLAVILWASAGIIAALFPSAGNEAQQVSAMAFLLRIFAWQIPLYAFGVAATGILHSVKSFVLPALAPVLSSITVIAAFALFGFVSHGADNLADLGTLRLLGWGVNAGVVALTLPLAFPLRKTGLKLRPCLRMPRIAVSGLLRLGGAGIAAVLAQQIATLAIIWGARANGQVGAQAVFMYGQAVAMLPYAVLVTPIATVMFPTIAQASDVNRPRHIARMVTKVFTVSVIGAAAVIAVAPAAAAFFTCLTPVPGLAASLYAQAPAVVGMGLIFALTRASLACSDARAVQLINITGWLIVAAGSIFFPWLFSAHVPDTATTVFGLGIAQSCGLVIGAVIGLSWFKHKYAFSLRHSSCFRDYLPALVGLLWAVLAAAITHLVTPAGIWQAIGAGILAALPLLAVIFWWWQTQGKQTAQEDA